MFPLMASEARTNPLEWKSRTVSAAEQNSVPKALVYNMGGRVGVRVAKIPPRPPNKFIDSFPTQSCKPAREPSIRFRRRKQQIQVESEDECGAAANGNRA